MFRSLQHPDSYEPSAHSDGSGDRGKGDCGPLATSLEIDDDLTGAHDPTLAHAHGDLLLDEDSEEGEEEEEFPGEGQEGTVSVEGSQAGGGAPGGAKRRFGRPISFIWEV
jgi:hypothetical protein